ncbi:hypothetical protein T492DRAFT_831520 [Pavlovales sp. CCMP2436]|nr:hypothetical protein T492DRAFT_831520 [Pavlovales sp. CCMP2436]
MAFAARTHARSVLRVHSAPSEIRHAASPILLTSLRHLRGAAQGRGRTEGLQGGGSTCWRESTLQSAWRSTFCGPHLSAPERPRLASAASARSRPYLNSRVVVAVRALYAHDHEREVLQRGQRRWLGQKAAGGSPAGAHHRAAAPVPSPPAPSRRSKDLLRTLITPPYFTVRPRRNPYKIGGACGPVEFRHGPKIQPETEYSTCAHRSSAAFRLRKHVKVENVTLRVSSYL